MQLYYITINIPKALYFLDLNLKYNYLINRTTKKFIKFFCYNFICLFFTISQNFYIFLKQTQKKISLKIYKQFLLHYLNFFFFIYLVVFA